MTPGNENTKSSKSSKETPGSLDSSAAPSGFNSSAAPSSLDSSAAPSGFNNSTAPGSPDSNAPSGTPSSPGIILVTGGVRSGKSTFAEQLAEQAAHAGHQVTYIATADAGDEEMRRRIEEHQKRRPAHFTTAEERYHPDRIIRESKDPSPYFLLDCLTLLLTNHLLRRWEGSDDAQSYLDGAREALNAVDALLQAAQTSPGTLLVVTNEVGMGVVPEHPLGRIFRDLAGQANQKVAAAADQVWFSVCGITRRWK